MEYLYILLGLMGGSIVYLFVKKNNAEAVNQNVEVRNELNTIGKDIAKDQGLADAEAVKREELKKASQPDPLKTVKEMEDFLNRDLTKRD